VSLLEDANASYGAVGGAQGLEAFVLADLFAPEISILLSAQSENPAKVR
jgi:hypothetical protein